MGTSRPPAGKKKLKSTHGTLVIEDESGFSLIPNLGRTWSPKGVTPTIIHNFNWKRVSTIGGITLDGKIYFQVHDETIKGKQVAEYLRQLCREIDSHIVLLWDGARPHTSRVAKDFLEENSDRITAFRLPPYHPRFNPVEFLWSYLKYSKMRGFCPMQLSDLKRKLRYSVNSVRRKPEMVQSYFRASAMPVGENAREKLLQYCRPEMIKELCIYQ